MLLPVFAKLVIGREDVAHSRDVCTYPFVLLIAAAVLAHPNSANWDLWKYSGCVSVFFFPADAILYYPCYPWYSIWYTGLLPFGFLSSHLVKIYTRTCARAPARKRERERGTCAVSRYSSNDVARNHEKLKRSLRRFEISRVVGKRMNFVVRKENELRMMKRYTQMYGFL